MRIAELSARSGLSVPTIKFYRREGLLPSGERVSANRVEYGTNHLYRLRLIRALTEIGNLALPSVRMLLEAADDSFQIPSDVLAAVIERSETARCLPARAGRWRAARDQVLRLLTVNGWRVRRGTEAIDAVADVLDCLQDFGQELPADVLAGYVRLAKATVAAEMRLVRRLPPGAIPPAVQVAIFHERLFAALRRLAREDWWSGHGRSTTSEVCETPQRRRPQNGVALPNRSLRH